MKLDVFERIQLFVLHFIMIAMVMTMAGVLMITHGNLPQAEAARTVGIGRWLLWAIAAAALLLKPSIRYAQVAYWKVTA